MRCLACKKLFRVKTTWENLFINRNYYLCNECIIKYPAKYTYVTIPLDSLVEVFSVFDTTHPVNPDSFILERKVLMEFIIKKYNLNKLLFLYYDTFDEFYKDIDYINILALFNTKIVVMLTYFSKF